MCFLDGSEGEVGGVLAPKFVSSISWPNVSVLVTLSLVELWNEELPVKLVINLYRDNVKGASTGTARLLKMYTT